MKYLKNLFSGRINRTQFIMGLIALFVLYMLGVLGILIISSDGSSTYSILFSALSFGYFFYSLALYVRRFHDLGKEGLYVLTLVIPIINLFFSLNLLFSGGQKEVNKFGSPPRGDTTLKLLFNPNNEEGSYTRTSLFCSQCGLKIDVDSSYCIKCGSKVPVT